MNVILIVEDQQDVQQLLGITLKRDDRRILHAYSADEGLHLVRRELPDIVLLDIMMPGQLDGMDLLREIRSDHRLNKARVIVMSALTQQSDQERALAAGANAYLCKPFHLERLHDLLENGCNDGTFNSS